MYIKVKDHDDLVRDPRSSAILNTDNTALQAYKEKKARDSKINNMLNEFENMKNDVEEIKSLLKQLVGQGK